MGGAPGFTAWAGAGGTKLPGGGWAEAVVASKEPESANRRENEVRVLKCMEYLDQSDLRAS